jgi:hypothetical protein
MPRSIPTGSNSDPRQGPANGKEAPAGAFLHRFNLPDCGFQQIVKYFSLIVVQAKGARPNVELPWPEKNTGDRMSMTTRKTIARGAMLMLCLAALPAMADEYTQPLTDLAKGKIAEIAANPELVAAVLAQNATTGSYDQTRIDALDAQWRTEVDADSKPLIDATLGNAASKYLSAAQDESAGLFTEIFATDAKGLDVAQSTITSDYWQGDEEKFTESYGRGPDAVFIGEIEQDESTQAFQSQVSVTIIDPASGAAIGSLTVGVDLSLI